MVRELEMGISDWCCSVSKVWVRIQSSENPKKICRLKNRILTMLGLIFRHINVFAVMSGMTTFAVKASHTVKAFRLNAFVQQRRKRRYGLVNCGVILKKRRYSNGSIKGSFRKTYLVSRDSLLENNQKKVNKRVPFVPAYHPQQQTFW